MDDDFAKDVSEFETLAEYKESLRAKLQESSEKRAAGAFEENVIEAVAANAAVDIPHVMVDQEIEQMLEEQKNQMRYQGIELEQYLGYIGQTLDAYKGQMHEPAEHRIKTRLVLEAVAKAEGITAADDEIEAEIERMAAQYNMKAEDLRTRFQDGSNGFVRDSVINRKTVELLTAQAVPVAPKALPPAAEQDAAELPAAAAELPADAAEISADAAEIPADAAVSESAETEEK